MWQHLAATVQPGFQRTFIFPEFKFIWVQTGMSFCLIMVLLTAYLVPSLLSPPKCQGMDGEAHGRRMVRTSSLFFGTFKPLEPSK